MHRQPQDFLSSTPKAQAVATVVQKQCVSCVSCMIRDQYDGILAHFSGVSQGACMLKILAVHSVLFKKITSRGCTAAPHIFPHSQDFSNFHQSITHVHVFARC